MSEMLVISFRVGQVSGRTNVRSHCAASASAAGTAMRFGVRRMPSVADHHQGTRRRRAPCLSEVRANRLQVRSRLRRRHRRGENNVFNELPMSGTKQRHRERLNARHRRGQRVPDKHTPPIVTTARLISVTDILVVIS